MAPSDQSSWLTGERIMASGGQVRRAALTGPLLPAVRDIVDIGGLWADHLTLGVYAHN
jgi:hypothetical protein